MKTDQTKANVSTGPSRYEEDESAFLQFLEKDIDKGNLVPLTASLIAEIQELVGDVDIDLDSEIEGDVELSVPRTTKSRTVATSD